MIDEQAKVFVRWLAVTLIFGILIVVTFVICIDPYRLYGLYKQDGINLIKPDLSRYMEEIKLTQALKLKPDTLIFGNSRAEIGFDPQSPVLMKKGYLAYNLAIRGTSLEASQRELDYLIAQGIKPKRLIIALDFVDFMSTSKRINSDQAKPQLPKIEFPVDQWLWRFDSLFSMTTIKDAINTVLIQNNSEAATMSERGFNPLREYGPLARNEGYFVLFQQRAKENAKTYLKKAAGTYDRSNFKYLQSMLKTAANMSTEVIVIIYPYHAQILALFDETGLFPVFERWKQETVLEVTNVSESSASLRTSVVDFSGYADYQCERIPDKGDLLSTTQWYWEAGHFKKTLGDIVLERSLFLASSALLVNQYDGFGIKLHKANIEFNRHRIDAEKARCQTNYPQLFTEVKNLTKSLLN